MTKHLTSITRALALLLLAATGVRAQDAFDGYYNYLDGRDWPDDEDTIYAEDVQGIAHSDSYWFITRQGDGVRLFKIHVSSNLANPTITASVSPSECGLTAYGYTHMKELDSFKNPVDGKWYLVVSVEGDGLNGVAFLDEALDLIAIETFQYQPPGGGWVAVHPDGRIFSGRNQTDYLRYYTLDWASLATTGDPQLQHDNVNDRMPLVSESGAALYIDRYQGGEFTPEGDKLFIVSGFHSESETPHGIHVFDATSETSYRRIIKSGQRNDVPPPLFEYEWDPFFDNYEEPEGLTFWDLDDGRAPGIRGQLHVLLLNNDEFGDNHWIKHYTNAIYVDRGFAGSPRRGDPATPDVSVDAGVSRALPDMEVRVRAGSYPESIVITKRVRLVKSGGSGPVVIGQ